MREVQSVVVREIKNSTDRGTAAGVRVDDERAAAVILVGCWERQRRRLRGRSRWREDVAEGGPNQLPDSRGGLVVRNDHGCLGNVNHFGIHSKSWSKVQGACVHKQQNRDRASYGLEVGVKLNTAGF